MPEGTRRDVELLLSRGRLMQPILRMGRVFWQYTRTDALITGFFAHREMARDFGVEFTAPLRLCFAAVNFALLLELRNI